MLGSTIFFPICYWKIWKFYGVGQQLYRVVQNYFIMLFWNEFILDGGGKSSRSFIYSDDMVNAFDLMIRKSKNFEEYNFSNEEISISDLVDKVCYFREKKILLSKKVLKDLVKIYTTDLIFKNQKIY